MPFHHASVRFEHSVCRGSFMTTFIMLLAWLVEHSLVHWYQQCVNAHHVSKCMSCHKAIAVITGRTHCFHDYIYITPSCFCEIWALCVMDHLWPLILSSMLGLLSTHVPKCPGYMSCHKAIVVITGRAYICVIAAGVTVSRGC